MPLFERTRLVDAVPNEHKRIEPHVYITVSSDRRQERHPLYSQPCLKWCDRLVAYLHRIPSQLKLRIYETTPIP